jgi:hypothetical protein
MPAIIATHAFAVADDALATIERCGLVSVVGQVTGSQSAKTVEESDGTRGE